MSFKIGFAVNNKPEKEPVKNDITVKQDVVPRKSVVQVYFPVRGLTCAYYNDAFDLHRGDLVYVDGKLEGLCGRVVDVSYTFKIKLSEYKRVIGKADTEVKGDLYFAGSNFIAFDSSVIPFEKIISWFRAPENPDEEYVFGSGDDTFSLNSLEEMNLQLEIAKRGKEYYLDNNVVYISVDGTKGHAIVEGSKTYEVEFTYNKGEISDLVCNCFCSYACKHEFAAMLQLRETLEIIEKNYSTKYEQSGYFAAINKDLLQSFAVDSKKVGSITLG